MDKFIYFLNNIHPTIAFIIINSISFLLLAILITLTKKYPDIFFKILAVGVIIGTIVLFILKLAIIAIAIIILFFVTLVKLNNN
ncbi:hypothetical protein [Helcococcus sueciensis]|uniref:hypothetical protein n=1 Tax=Helcococcus sueciensis TaxID=241555 RepID=UPI0003F7E4D5|nr:hypothetical protein [Helcococcus sueciensis]